MALEKIGMTECHETSGILFWWYLACTDQLLWAPNRFLGCKTIFDAQNARLFMIADLCEALLSYLLGSGFIVGLCISGLNESSSVRPVMSPCKLVEN